MKRPVIGKPSEQKLHLKVLIYGPSGAGKTRLAATFPKPILFDLERGTMSIRGQDVAVVDKDQITPESLLEFAAWVASDEAKEYETVIIDSLTELQAQFLDVKKARVNDPRQAYGMWNDFVRSLLTTLYTAKKHVVLIARSKLTDNNEGQTMIFPELSPGAWSNVPALVDYGLYLVKRQEGIGQAAKVVPTVYTDVAPVVNAWGKARTQLPLEIKNPTFNRLAAAIKKSLEASNEPVPTT